MGKAKRLITSALVITGATALSTVEVGATEQDPNLFSENDLDLIEQDLMEQALRNYTNPFNRIKAEMKQDRQATIIYHVKEGDTISEIASKFAVTSREVVEQNQITNRHRISIGQELKIRVVERKYVVKFGDKLEEIAQQNGISLDDLLSSNHTLRYTAAQLYPGLEIQVPTSVPQLPSNESSPSREKMNTLQIASRSGEATVQAGGFIWPVSGTITSRFGMRWGRPHNGIDIASPAKKNAPINAVLNGVVAEAYFHKGGYGNLVILDHGDGVKTYYAHLSKISVSKGQEVGQGDLLGYMGQTGRATGYHLHFEIRKNDRPVNPMRYLAK